MKNLFWLIRRCFKKETAAVTTHTSTEETFIRVQNLSQRSATVLAFKSARRWPPDALDRLAEDLAAARPSQTNANIIKFPRYRQQYKQGLRPVTRR